jgi:hypothetical protein
MREGEGREAAAGVSWVWYRYRAGQWASDRAEECGWARKWGVGLMVTIE